MLIAESLSSIKNQLTHKNQPAQMNMSATYGHIGDQISNKQRSYPPWVQNTMHINALARTTKGKKLTWDIMAHFFQKGYPYHNPLEGLVLVVRCLVL